MLYILDTADENLVCKNINFSALAKTLDISRASLYRAKNELLFDKHKFIIYNKTNISLGGNFCGKKRRYSKK